VCVQLHLDKCKETGVKLEKEGCYEQIPKLVETSHECEVTILWNRHMQTDRPIPNNKLDVMIRDNENGTCMVVDGGISGDRNVIKKEAEKIQKYEDVTIEIQRIWNAKTKVMPVIMGQLEPPQNHSDNT
jgi:hypothetical protein